MEAFVLEDVTLVGRAVSSNAEFCIWPHNDDRFRIWVVVERRTIGFTSFGEHGNPGDGGTATTVATVATHETALASRVDCIVASGHV